MAILGIPLETARAITRDSIQSYFETYGRYIPDSPRLYSNDTYDPRKQFGREIGRIKRTAKNKRLTRN